MYLNKHEHTPIVLAPKRCTHCGRSFGAVNQECSCTSGRDSVAGENTTPRLSIREKQIVGLIQQAKSNKEIAYELCLTVGTVKEYMYHIFRKLGVANRTELALWGRKYQVESAS